MLTACKPLILLDFDRSFNDAPTKEKALIRCGSRLFLYRSMIFRLIIETRSPPCPLSRPPKTHLPADLSRVHAQKSPQGRQTADSLRASFPPYLLDICPLFRKSVVLNGNPNFWGVETSPSLQKKRKRSLWIDCKTPLTSRPCTAQPIQCLSLTGLGEIRFAACGN